jgi:hypothetical protein
MDTSHLPLIIASATTTLTLFVQLYHILLYKKARCNDISVYRLTICRRGNCYMQPSCSYTHGGGGGGGNGDRARGRGKGRPHIYVFPEKALRGLSPSFHIHVSVSELYIPMLGRPVLLEVICRLILGIL